MSPYRQFTIEEWAELGLSTPQPLTEQELAELRGINERVSLEEVGQVYLPISRLLSFHVASLQQLWLGTRQYLGTSADKVPFIIGVAGSVGVGKSTVSRVLQSLLKSKPEHSTVDVISTDGFLHPTAVLEAKGIMHRKGFPESFDRAALLTFLEAVKSGASGLKAPVYSHLHYDIVPDKFITVNQPDILIVEGLNVLQTGRQKAGAQQAFVSDYFDFSIYIDAREEQIEQWYVERFLALRHTVFNQPDAYFSHYANLSEDEARETATGIWRDINRVNLTENILPSRPRAKLILRKGANHSIDCVQFRKL